MGNVLLWVAVTIVLAIIVRYVVKNCDTLLKETLNTKVGVHECKALQLDYQKKLDEVKIYDSNNLF